MGKMPPCPSVCPLQRRSQRDIEEESAENETSGNRRKTDKRHKGFEEIND